MIGYSSMAAWSCDPEGFDPDETGTPAPWVMWPSRPDYTLAEEQRARVAHGWKPSGGVVLRWLVHNPPSTAWEVAEALGLDHRLVTSRLSQLFLRSRSVGREVEKTGRYWTYRYSAGNFPARRRSHGDSGEEG